MKPLDVNARRMAGEVLDPFATVPMNDGAGRVARIGPWAHLPLEPHPALGGSGDGSGRPPLPPFPVAAFPDDVAAFVEGVATFTQTPVDLAGCLALGVLSASVAGKARVRVKGHYAEPLNLFVVAAMPPGERKSAVFRSLFGPFARYEKVLRESGKAKREAVRAERKALEDETAALRKRLARAKDGDRVEIDGELATLRDRLERLPACEEPVLYLQDVTAERLAKALEDQGGRIAIADAEGVFFNNILGRYGDEVNLDSLLKGHAGDFLRVERVNRPAQNIERPAITLAMAVQPDVLRSMAQKPGVRDRGLLGRMLMSLPASKVGSREVDPPDVPRPVWARYADGVRRLLELVVPTDDHLLDLEPEALAVWHDVSRELERMLGHGGDLAQMRDWGSKAAGAVARIAGVLHFAWAACAGPEALRAAWTSPVTEGEMGAAAELGWYFVEHARAVYDELLLSQEEREGRGRLADALAALEWVYPGGKGFTVAEALEKLFPATKVPPPPAAAAAREAVAAFAGARGSDPPKPLRLGKALSAAKGRDAGGLRLDQAGGAHRKVVRWVVTPAPRPGAGGNPSGTSPPFCEAENGSVSASGGMGGVGGVPLEKPDPKGGPDDGLTEHSKRDRSSPSPTPRSARRHSSIPRGIEGREGSIRLRRIRLDAPGANALPPGAVPPRGRVSAEGLPLPGLPEERPVIMAKKYMLPLLVPIRAEHREEADGKLAACLAGLEAVEAQLKAAREEKKRLEAERKTVNQRLSRKVWEEPVLCEERRVGNTIEVVRLDTQEVIRSFKADQGEPQASLGFDN